MSHLNIALLQIAPGAQGGAFLPGSGAVYWE